MNLHEEINRQRVKHIVDSYRLDKDDNSEQFAAYLNQLLLLYPTPVLELALAETIAYEWLNVPITRGRQFLEKVHAKIKTWETCEAEIAISLEQFQHITGLSPHPLLGSSNLMPV